jgi:cytochrome c
MLARSLRIGAIVVAVSAVISGATAAEGDLERGAQAFRPCAACHSLEPGKHRTGPSLAGIWGKKAGTVQDFSRYSSAFKSAQVTWNEDTLDAWLADPAAFIRNNRMTFPGMRDEQARADLIAYLEAATAEGSTPQESAGQGGMMGGGMTGSTDMPGLEAVDPDQRVTAIRYCGDTYHVTTAAGETIAFWEFNLRFKTDSSEKGPSERQPALLPASGMGDRAFVIFARPAEISSFIEKRC